MKTSIDANGFVIVGKKKFQQKPLAQLLRSLRIVEYFTDAELMALPAGSVFIFDTECYPNFWYAAFKHIETGKFIAFERSPAAEVDATKLSWFLWTFCVVGFNSINYDMPMLALALTGANTTQLKEASDYIIKSGINYSTKKVTSYDFEKKYRVKIPRANHIDLFNVCPVNGGVGANPASLKLYAGRLHAPRMQDLPIAENHHLTEEEAGIVRNYCANDLDNTELLFNELAPEIKLRMEMSEQYGVDLRSKSDAQIAEAVINSELEKVLGYYPQKPTIKEGTILQYNVPDFVSFQSKQLQDVLEVIRNARFELDALGSPIMPVELEKLTVRLGSSLYTLGMGGLHSNEKIAAHTTAGGLLLRDNDVARFYPSIILNQKLFPPNLGEAFLHVYQAIVDKRDDAKEQAKKAKKAGDKEAFKRWKSIDSSIKIVINGSFGKLGNKYSTLYAPQLMLQVTLTGQLVLLMLIEMLESVGINVISGNTDGIISKYAESRHAEVRAIIAQWEKQTDFKTEETNYSAVYSRDVNSYIAIKEDGEDAEARFLDEKLGCKTKGAYCERGSALNSVLSKNAEMLVCNDAVLKLLTKGIPLHKTITECKDIRRFVSIKNVKGGEKDGMYLGKVVRWYYPKGEQGCINYVLSGNKVGKTDGARPLMDLPAEFPNDIDYSYYIKEATEMLYEVGYLKTPTTASLF